tara:strand:+ start:229 stop:420 length:192 start_codon:yes stop_codon:yes gene_type:complete
MLEAAEQMAMASVHAKSHTKSKTGTKTKAKGMLKAKNKDDMFAQIDNSINLGLMAAEQTNQLA